MKIYKLKDELANFISDSYSEKIIVAGTSKQARKLANTQHGDEGPIWEDTKRVKCKQINLNKPQVLI